MEVGLEKRWTKRSIDGGPSWRMDVRNKVNFVSPTVLEVSSEIETFHLESLKQLKIASGSP